MKLFYRKENIDPGLHRTFERYGMVAMQVVLGSRGYVARASSSFAF
jgi:hypothetical protein